MSDIQGPFSSLIEDYTGVITSNVVPAGQHRWYNKYDNQDATRVVYVIGDGTSTIAALDKHSLEKTDEEVSTTTATIAASGSDHTVFVDTDTAGAAVTLTVTDAGTANDRLTVVAIGTYAVALTITGLTSEEVPIGEARAYVWEGSAWVLASGGGGGSGNFGNLGIGEVVWFPGSGPISYDKLVCDGALYDISSYPGLYAVLGTEHGGDGITTFGVPNLQGITPGAFGTQDINGNTKGDSTPIGGVREDQIESHTHIQDGHTHIDGDRRQATTGLDLYGLFSRGTAQSISVTSASQGSASAYTSEQTAVNQEAGEGTYNRSTELVGRWLIQAFDTVQEIPADPGLIKDWVEKLGTPQTSYAPITNSWGNGKYIFVCRTVSGNTFTYNLDVDIDAISAGADAFSATTNSASNARVGYDKDTNTFNQEASTPFISIKRWEDVAGADAQMSVPVDGWEEKYNDHTNTSNVVNSFGDGYFRILVRRSDNLVLMTGALIVDTTLVSSLEQYSAQGLGSSQVKILYDVATNSFSSPSATGTFYIAEIHKFNSLVNVLHSYVPDPRSVAQKDWVEVFHDYSNTSTIQNTWGDGEYRVSLKTVSGPIIYTGVLHLDSSESLTDSYSMQGAASNNYRARYEYSTSKFSALNSAGNIPYIVSIERYQDSQASDAPRTVLEDGWETVYDVPGNTTQTITELVANGTYELVVAGATNQYSMNIVVNNSITSCKAAFATSSEATYTTATGLWDSGSASFNIKRIRKFTGLLRIDSQVVTNTSEGSNITNAVIDTDAGDVDCTSYFTDTTQDRVVKLTNDGTNGNHLTNCPNSIEIGDGKTVQFYYNLGWRYEDVIIDEYVSSGQKVIKWAGGIITIDANLTESSHAIATVINSIYVSDSAITVAFPETLTAVRGVTTTADTGTTRIFACRTESITTSGFSLKFYRANTGIGDVGYSFFATGTWK